MKIKDFELLPDPVWIEEDGVLQPTPFFRNWWEQFAKRRFGDKGRIIDAARGLGYIGICYYDSTTDRAEEGPIGFSYDPALYRESLGLPSNMPLVSNNGNPNAYQHLWDYLLKGKGNG